MRRKDKEHTERNWKACVQTIHAMLFLVYNPIISLTHRQEDQNNDFGVKQFNKPFVYKDTLLSAHFVDGVHDDLPAWLSSSLRDGLFDCYFRCALSIRLPETSMEYASLLEGNELPSFLLQAIIKPCPSHLVPSHQRPHPQSQPQVLHQSRALPAFPSLFAVDHPLSRQLLTLSLLDDNSNPAVRLLLLLHRRTTLPSVSPSPFTTRWCCVPQAATATSFSPLGVSSSFHCSSRTAGTSLSPCAPSPVSSPILCSMKRPACWRRTWWWFPPSSFSSSVTDRPTCPSTVPRSAVTSFSPPRRLQRRCSSPHGTCCPCRCTWSTRRATRQPAVRWM